MWRATSPPRLRYTIGVGKHWSSGNAKRNATRISNKRFEMPSHKIRETALADASIQQAGEVADFWGSRGADREYAVEKQVSLLAACLGQQRARMTCRPIEGMRALTLALDT